MEEITIIGLLKTAPTTNKKITVYNNTVPSVNRLDSLLNVTLTTPTNKQNFYCNAPTTFNKRSLASKNTTTMSDFQMTSIASQNIVRYNTSTGIWANRMRMSCSAVMTWPPTPTPAGVTALNAGTEISLFNNTYWYVTPTISGQSTAFYTYNNTTQTFDSTGILNSKVVLTLFVNMTFGTLPANSYFIYRIKDVTNSVILVESRIYNTGSSVDYNKEHTLTTICNSSSSYAFTVQYIGTALTRNENVNYTAIGNRMAIQELC